MKKRYNIVGAGWVNTDNGNKGYSIYKQEGKYIEWDISGQNQETFYVDHSIPLVFDDDKSVKKYAWIYEPPHIYPHLYEDMKRNYLHYIRVYDAIFMNVQYDELLTLNKKFKQVYQYGTWVTEPKIYEKTKLVSMIASNILMCDGHQYRLEWVQRLKDKLDFYGRGFNPIANKEDGLKDYMFSVAIENKSFMGYFSEKIQDCFATGTIPIYHGAPDIGKFFNPNGIITLTDDFDVSSLTPELYYDKMDAVKENFEIVQNSLIVDDYLYKTFLEN